MSCDDCDICGKPMIEGQQFYAGIRHWDCQYPNGYRSPKEIFDEAAQAADRLGDAIARLKRRLS
jgi:hypothetical protein